jgi:hypothetical protein
LFPKEFGPCFLPFMPSLLEAENCTLSSSHF